jgi:flavorubredoxin
VKAIVVYESLWGNTAAIAKAIAEGIGEGAVAVSTAEATPELMEGADLMVAGAPLLGFALPTDAMRDSIRQQPSMGPKPDLSHPTVRAWLASLPRSTARSASFETRIWWSPGSAAKTIMTELEKLGYKRAAEPAKFIVTGKYGPLKAGEIERARAWGAELAQG